MKEVEKDELAILLREVGRIGSMLFADDFAKEQSQILYCYSSKWRLRANLQLTKNICVMVFTEESVEKVGRAS